MLMHATGYKKGSASFQPCRASNRPSLAFRTPTRARRSNWLVHGNLERFGGLLTKSSVRDDMNTAQDLATPADRYVNHACVNSSLPTMEFSQQPYHNVEQRGMIFIAPITSKNCKSTCRECTSGQISTRVTPRAVQLLLFNFSRYKVFSQNR